MMVVIPIHEAPRPVYSNSVNVEVRYVVIRGNGDAKVFDTLDSAGHDSWGPMFQKPPHVSSLPTITIPVDIFTATRLGLVNFNELELPEGMKALINMIK